MRNATEDGKEGPKSAIPADKDGLLTITETEHCIFVEILHDQSEKSAYERMNV
jgi:hypothetical protein